MSNNTHHTTCPPQWTLPVDVRMQKPHQLKLIHAPHEIGLIFMSENDHYVAFLLMSDITCTFLRQVATSIVHPFASPQHAVHLFYITK